MPRKAFCNYALLNLKRSVGTSKQRQQGRVFQAERTARAKHKDKKGPRTLHKLYEVQNLCRESASGVVAIDMPA